MIRRLSSLACVISLVASALGVGIAHAYPDARLNEQLKPRFGDLIQPPLHRDRCVRGRRCGGGQYSGYDGDGDGRRRYERDRQAFAGGSYGNGSERSQVVDCGHADGPTPIADALSRLVDGGTLFIRAGGGACTETVVIQRPVTIVGDGIPAFATGPNPMPATLAPAPDAPCFVIDNVKSVEIRDLVMEARQARDHGCIEAYDSDVALTRVVLRYEGNASAVYADGGRLAVAASTLDARTFDPALVADGVQADVRDTVIRGDAVGVSITLGANSASTFFNVGVLAHRDGGADGRAETGFQVHGTREASQTMSIQDTTVWGWRTGISVGRGASVAIDHTRIGHSGTGVLSNGDLDLRQALIGASKVGVYVAGGTARIGDIVLHGFTQAPIVTDPGSQISESEEWVFTQACDPYGQPRWTCRQVDQLPPAYGDDAIGDTGPWGWRDESYRSIPSRIVPGGKGRHSRRHRQERGF